VIKDSLTPAGGGRGPRAAGTGFGGRRLRLMNQHGAILDRALRRHTDAVICRLRFRVDVPR